VGAGKRQIISRRVYTRVERGIIGLMLLGIIAMFQPFVIELYRYGFLLLLLSTIFFIIVSHMSPIADRDDGTGTVDLDQATEHMQGHN
jgi:hypothetical protein